MFIKVTDKASGMLLLINTAHILGINKSVQDDGMGSVIKLAVGDTAFIVAETMDELIEKLTGSLEPWVTMEK